MFKTLLCYKYILVNLFLQLLNERSAEIVLTLFRPSGGGGGGGGGGFCSRRLWTLITFLLLKQTLPNLATFSLFDVACHSSRDLTFPWQPYLTGMFFQISIPLI